MESFLGLKILAVGLLDVALGDPRWFPHPVRVMGIIIHRCELLVLALCQSPLSKMAVGAVLALGLPYGCFVIVQECIWYMNNVNEALGILAWIVFGYTTLAARDLWDHAMSVHQAMTTCGLSEARVAVSQIVGRDTTHLSESEVVRATIESVSENSSDGIVAPLFYLALGGPPLAMAYKAVNTLDSMIGYRNVKYEDLGWASARLDDLVNWIPARLTAVAIAVAASWRLGSGQTSWKICWRDARKHPSPNSGWPEAAMAGALGVQLGGVSEYGRRSEERARLGDPGSPLHASQIPIALEVVSIASLCLMGLALLMVTW